MSMRRSPEPADVAVNRVETLRDLAAQGRLRVAAREPSRAAELWIAAYDLAWPLVWSRHTRRLEAAKGHRRCASSFGRLDSTCLDGFHDDVEATVAYLFRYAHEPIHSLEAWITTRIGKAVVDGHRQRRSTRGALQRNRVPKWLVTGLDGDPWLVELASRTIEWVGVPTTAGTRTWPLESWADFRAAATGDRGGSHPGRIAADLARVLDTMATARPAWFAQYIERPLGAKQTPVAPVAEDVREDTQVAGVDEDARLGELAAAAVEAIDAGLAAGQDPGDLVPTVLRAVFLENPSAPETSGLGSVFADETALADLVRRVLAVVRRTD